MMIPLSVELWIDGSSFLGAAVCMGFGAIGAAVGEGYAAGVANAAVSRNPQLAGPIFKTMLVGQALAESASIFALVVAMILLFTYGAPHDSWLMGVGMLSSGICMGLGAVGSGIGSGFPAAEACAAVERQPAAANRFLTGMLVGSAVCQTPAIFSLVVSLLLVFSGFGGKPVHPTWAAVLGAGLCMGLGAIGPALGEGFAAGKAVKAMGRNPKEADVLTRTMLVGQAVTESTAIYSLVVALLLLFVM